MRPMSGRPYVVGIAGGTGSGKTTVAERLAAALPAGRCVTIDHDAYYRDQSHLAPAARADVNYDHPATLDSALFAEHLRELRAGSDIRLMRRIRRDLEERGRSFQSVRDQYYATVRPMHLEHVEPSKRWADLILPEGGNNRVALDILLGQLWRIAND